MSEYSIGKLIGASVGLLVGIVLVIIATKFSNRNKSLKTEYDERQQILRGVGFKYGFYGMLIYGAITTILGIADLPLPLEPAVMGFSYVFIGAIIDIGYCIFHDCYWGLNNNRLRWGIVMAVAGVINAIAAIVAIKEGAFINDGNVSTPGINALCAILLICLAIFVAIKASMEKKEASE